MGTSSIITMAEEQQFSIPGAECLKHACKLALVDDKPIMMDYYADSVEKKVIIGVRENGEKLLVKSADEYTSPISKIYKSGEEYIIVTENSIYLVSAAIENKRIS
jgi:hypothetical protein